MMTGLPLYSDNLNFSVANVEI